MLSQTMFSFPFVFVHLSVDLLILTHLVLGMTNEENFDGSSSRPGSSTCGEEQLLLIYFISPPLDRPVFTYKLSMN